MYKPPWWFGCCFCRSSWIHCWLLLAVLSDFFGHHVTSTFLLCKFRGLPGSTPVSFPVMSRWKCLGIKTSSQPSGRTPLKRAEKTCPSGSRREASNAKSRKSWLYFKPQTVNKFLPGLHSGTYLYSPYMAVPPGWLASRQTSFGVRSSRIHFCVTNEPRRKSAGRLLDDLFCTPLTAVINFESRNCFWLFLLTIKPDTQDYSFLKFSQLVFSSLVGLAWV